MAGWGVDVAAALESLEGVHGFLVLRGALVDAGADWDGHSQQERRLACSLLH